MHSEFVYINRFFNGGFDLFKAAVRIFKYAYDKGAFMRCADCQKNEMIFTSLPKNF